MRRMVILSVVLLLALAIGGCGIVPREGTHLILGGNDVIATGEVVNEPLTVLGGNVTVEEGARLTGDLFVLGGNVTANGEIERDVHLYGGNLTLGPSAVVRGDISRYGGNVTQSPGARVEGQIATYEGVRLPFEWSPQVVRIGQGIGYVFRTLLVTILAGVVVLLWPNATGRVATAMWTTPGVVAAVGLVTVIGVPILLVLCAITLILLPVTLVGALLLAAAGLFGWIALGLETGRRLSAGLDLGERSPVLFAVGGTLVFTLVVDAIGLIPWVGWIAPTLASIIGIGAVVLTRFGTRAYAPPAGPTVPPAPMEQPTAM